MITSTSERQARFREAPVERRDSPRVTGPFDAWRVGGLETPVRIYDIGLGGCFVHAMHEQEVGAIVILKIELPGSQWVEVKAETLYCRPGFGFAVRFLDLDGDVLQRLERVLRASEHTPRPS